MDDRAKDALFKLIRAAFPNYDLLGTKEYIVHTQTGPNTYDLEPAPTQSKVDASPASGGWTGTNSTGAPIGPFALGQLTLERVDGKAAYYNTDPVTFSPGVNAPINIVAAVPGRTSGAGAGSIALAPAVAGLTGTNAFALNGVDAAELVPSNLPHLSDVPVKPGIPGAKFTLQIGSLVYVEFVNQDESKAMIFAFGNSDDPGFVPSDLSLDGDDVAIAPGGGTVELSTPSAIPVGPVPGRYIRYGDLYTVGTPGSTIPLTFTGVAPISKVSG